MEKPENPSIKIGDLVLTYLLEPLGSCDKDGKYIFGIRFEKWLFYWFFRRRQLPKYYRNFLIGFHKWKNEKKYRFICSSTKK